MDVPDRALVDRMSDLLAAGAVDLLAGMYAADGKIVTYADVASGRDEIRASLYHSLAFHGRYEIASIDSFRNAGDLMMWDASVKTATGILQTTHVVVLDDDGLIRHHVPGVRGYWGM